MFEIPASCCPGAKVQSIVSESLWWHDRVPSKLTDLFQWLNSCLVVVHVESAGVATILESFWEPLAEEKTRRMGGQITDAGGSSSPISQAAPANTRPSHGRSPVYGGLPDLAPITFEDAEKKI